MSNRLERGVRALLGGAGRIQNAVTVSTLTAAGYPAGGVGETGERNAMKLSAVNACVEVLSSSIGKLPAYVMDGRTRERVEHPLNALLSVRPNEAQTPTVAKKLVEGNRNCGGNGYLWIVRSPSTLRPEQLIPVPHELVTPWLDTGGRLWYSVLHPFTGEPITVHRADMIHLMAYTYNGWEGVSVLQRASDAIGAGRAAQQYNLNYYQNGGQPPGILIAKTDISGYREITLADGSTERVPKKEILRREWEAHTGGPSNRGRTAILDYDLEYKPISINNRDAQFVEQSELTVLDICRFFSVPAYKLQAGKQSYQANEQHAIEYVVSTLHPIVSQYEEELTWKLLTQSEIARGLEIRINLMAELRGDFSSRSAWYKAMRETGVFSINDIRALEDLPDVEGGDERYASLNYVPASVWRSLSISRNTEGGTARENHT